MRRGGVLLLLLIAFCVACAGPALRYPGYYERTEQAYINDTVGFRLSVPGHWAVATRPQDFTVPLGLRPDQEQVLEAYDSVSVLGLVIVVQQGPLVEIAELVRRMQAIPQEQIPQRLQSPHASDVRQTTIREIVVNGHAAAEWIYTALDTTGGQSADMTVISYILKVREQYVYLTFSVPSAQVATAQPIIASILHTFDHLADI